MSSLHDRAEQLASYLADVADNTGSVEGVPSVYDAARREIEAALREQVEACAKVADEHILTEGINIVPLVAAAIRRMKEEG